MQATEESMNALLLTIEVLSWLMPWGFAIVAVLTSDIPMAIIAAALLLGDKLGDG